jgi:hypothetical protein
MLRRLIREITAIAALREMRGSEGVHISVRTGGDGRS